MSSHPKVSFYPLQTVESDAVLSAACRLTQKAFGLGMLVHLHCNSEEQGRQLDKLLWQFRPASFLPHAVLTKKTQSAEYQITIGYSDFKPKQNEVLVNLASEVWQHHAEFTDIRDIVSADEQAREQGRLRFRHYKSQGYAIETLT